MLEESLGFQGCIASRTCASARDLQTLANDMTATSAGSDGAFEETQMRVSSNIKRVLADMESDEGFRRQGQLRLGR